MNFVVKITVLFYFHRCLHCIRAIDGLRKFLQQALGIAPVQSFSFKAMYTNRTLGLIVHALYLVTWQRFFAPVSTLPSVVALFTQTNKQTAAIKPNHDKTYEFVSCLLTQGYFLPCLLNPHPSCCIGQLMIVIESQKSNFYLIFFKKEEEEETVKETKIVSLFSRACPL